MKFTREDAEYKLSFQSYTSDPEFPLTGKPIPMISIEKANAKLEEWLKAALIVYVNGNESAYDENGTWREWTKRSNIKSTHKAKLVCIEEIK